MPSPRGIDVRATPVRAPKEAWERAQSLAREENTTTYVVCASILKLFLARLTGDRRVMIISPNELARGLSPHLSSTLGFFLDYFLLDSDYAQVRTLREAVRLERDVVLGAYADADLPSSMILDDVCPWDNPLARVVLNYIETGGDHQPPAIPGVVVEPVDVHAINPRRTDLVWLVVGAGAGSALVAAGDRFDDATVSRLSRDLADFLDAATATPDDKIL